MLCPYLCVYVCAHVHVCAQCICLCVPVKWLQSCPTICNTMYYTPPGSSVHGDSSGKNTGVDCHALLQGIFQIQGWNLCVLHCRQILYQ